MICRNGSTNKLKGWKGDKHRRSASMHSMEVKLHWKDAENNKGRNLKAMLTFGRVKTGFIKFLKNGLVKIGEWCTLGRSLIWKRAYIVRLFQEIYLGKREFTLLYFWIYVNWSYVESKAQCYIKSRFCAEQNSNQNVGCSWIVQFGYTRVEVRLFTQKILITSWMKFQRA